MDARVFDQRDFAGEGSGAGSDGFLLNEGLEVLALYRSIRNEAVRLAVKEMIALVAKTTDNLQ